MRRTLWLILQSHVIQQDEMWSVQSPADGRQILHLRRHYLRWHLQPAVLPRSHLDAFISLNEIRQKVEHSSYSGTRLNVTKGINVLSPKSVTRRSRRRCIFLVLSLRSDGTVKGELELEGHGVTNCSRDQKVFAP